MDANELITLAAEDLIKTAAEDLITASATSRPSPAKPSNLNSNITRLTDSCAEGVNTNMCHPISSA
jgi:hypothetical protein